MAAAFVVAVVCSVTEVDDAELSTNMSIHFKENRVFFYSTMSLLSSFSHIFLSFRDIESPADSTMKNHHFKNDGIKSTHG